MTETPTDIENIRRDRPRLGDPARASEDERRSALQRLIAEMPAVLRILTTIRDLELQDAWLVSGGLYQNAWNILTGRPEGYGIKDYDVTYFDGSDLSYEAEDRVIQSVAAKLSGITELVETRNQARVHLWYPGRFGRAYPQLTCTTEALTFYASKTHAIAARITQDGQIELAAPYGLSNIFAMRLVPNKVLDNARTHMEKGERMKALWPELEVVGWDDVEV